MYLCVRACVRARVRVCVYIEREGGRERVHGGFVCRLAVNCSYVSPAVAPVTRMPTLQFDIDATRVRFVRGCTLSTHKQQTTKVLVHKTSSFPVNPAPVVLP